MSLPTTQAPPSPSNHQPIIHYTRQFVFNGVLVYAAVTNLAAAFLDELGDDPESAGN